MSAENPHFDTCFSFSRNPLKLKTRIIKFSPDTKTSHNASGNTHSPAIAYTEDNGKTINPRARSENARLPTCGKRNKI